jgi:hypothetical protein
LDHYIAKIDADPEIHTMVFRQFGSKPFDALLNLDGGTHCLDRTREFGNNAVARAAKYSAVVFTDELLDQVATVLENPKSQFFIATHQAREARTIRTEDCRQLTLWPVLFHGASARTDSIQNS